MQYTIQFNSIVETLARIPVNIYKLHIWKMINSTNEINNYYSMSPRWI